MKLTRIMYTNSDWSMDWSFPFCHLALFLLSKNFFVCVCGLALFVLFGLRLSLFCSSIWILAGWIVIWIIICFVDWYYFGCFYLEFVFSGWLDWNLMQVNCIDMHRMLLCRESMYQFLLSLHWNLLQKFGVSVIV